MMEKDKLRKADIFSGGIIMLFGLWVISRALQMPMKDSWGGVQNVWFVSPALFPLFVGSMITLLGGLLVGIASKETGSTELKRVLRWLGSRELLVFLKSPPIIRFWSIVFLFVSFVFLYIPRIDFFICSVTFLLAFITMFYFDDDALLKKLFFFYLGGTALILFYFIFGVSAAMESTLPFPNDFLALFFLAAYGTYVWILIRKIPALRKKYRTSLILALAAPFLIGPIFKYFLLVPMPREGLIVTILDAVWYWDF